MYRFAQRAKAPVIRRWYDQMSRIDRGRNMTFMNYGWAGLDAGREPLALHPDDESNRYSIQLYDHVAGAVDLRGLDVLEVGCGRGGGASWIIRYLGPRTMTGLDFSTRGIEFCREHYSTPGLSFVVGDAQELDFGPESFDAVVNIESSHCYRSMKQFFSSVFRILRPGGYFLYADYHSENRRREIRRLLAESGMVMIREENISPNVLRALELDNARKAGLIDGNVPRIFRKFFYEFAGMEGTHTFNSTLRSGEKVYSCFVLQSPVGIGDSTPIPAGETVPEETAVPRCF